MHVNEKRFAGLRDAAMLSAPVGARGGGVSQKLPASAKDSRVKNTLNKSKVNLKALRPARRIGTALRYHRPFWGGRREAARLCNGCLGGSAQNGLRFPAFAAFWQTRLGTEPPGRTRSIFMNTRQSKNSDVSAAVRILVVDAALEGMRLDNWLLRNLKGVPKSHVYRIIRSGEVRLNGGRTQAGARVQAGDKVRIPPLRTASAPQTFVPTGAPLPLVHEDAALLVLDKPAGLAVHGGSGVAFGVIEQLRRQRPDERFLELAHRLDRETSGLLIVARKRSALRALHDMLREGRVEKRYLALVKGRFPNAREHIRLPLEKYLLPDGERRVRVSKQGKPAHSIVRRLQCWADYSLLEVELKTGRTHQIRVHLASQGFPLMGDEKYGDFALNKALEKQGLKRMFLHAAQLALPHPASGEMLRLAAPLPPALQAFVAQLGAPDEACAAHVRTEQSRKRNIHEKQTL